MAWNKKGKEIQVRLLAEPSAERLSAVLRTTFLEQLADKQILDVQMVANGAIIFYSD
jgi:hypothetical protein